MQRITSGLFILIVFVFVFVFAACEKLNQPSVSVAKDTTTNNAYFIVPDKIVVYKNGNSQNISKDSKLFSAIVNQMSDRINNQIDILRLGFFEDNMNAIKQKEIVVEFVYLKNQNSKFGTIEKQYIKLIFPLTGDNNELCFFDNGKGNYSGPIGRLSYPDALLDLLK